MLFSPLEKALHSLEDILAQPMNEYIRDGAIQRFEYTFELSWKLLKRYFNEIGRQDIAAGPRPIIKEAGKEGLIGDVEAWLEFLEARNKTSHLYNEKEAQSVFDVAKNFPIYVKKLLEEIKKKNG